MGFFDKSMDVAGLDADPDAVARVDRLNAAQASVDTLGRKIDATRHVPAILAFGRRWTAGVPDRWPEAGP